MLRDCKFYGSVYRYMMDSFRAVTEWQKSFGRFSEYVARDLTYLHVFGSEEEETMGALMVTKNDEVFGVGYSGDWGLLGGPTQPYDIYPEARVHALCGKKVTRISVGETVGAAITAHGKILNWGRHITAGYLRYFPEVLGVHHPQGSEAHLFVQVACGSKFVAALTNTHNVLLWGLIDRCSEPQQAYMISTCPIKSFACGLYHVTMLSASGDVFTCGNGSYGQLGRYWNTRERYLMARLVDDLEGRCIQVACGSRSSLFLMSDGALYATGSSEDDWGHLGIQSDELYELGFVHNPERVNINEPVTRIAANMPEYGPSIYAAVTISGTIFSWGDHEFPKKIHGETELISAFYGLATPPHLGEVCACRNCKQKICRLYPNQNPS